MRWGAGWIASLDGARDVVGRAADRALACVLVLCALMLVCRALAAAWRIVHERRIVRAWMRPTRVCAPDRKTWGWWARLVRGTENPARHRGRAQGAPTPRELSLLVAEVATRLRAGAPTSAAWGLALARIGAGGIMPESASYPPILDEWAREPTRWELPVRARAPDAAARRTAASVALACRFSHGLGAPMADILDAIGDSIDDGQSVAEARRVASAGPLMSARVLAVLPLVGITCALALGASPWQFYTGGTVGRICALLGAAAWVVGIASCRRILERARSTDEDTDPALACDLAAAGLACGAAIPRVLDALAAACARESLAWTAQALRLGVSWADAWEETPEWTRPLRDALESSWTSGSAPETMLARSASWERRSRLAEAKTRAEELSVRLVGPLGVCFLPAFLALGIAPLLASLTGGLGM